MRKIFNGEARTEFLITVVLDNFSSHMSTKTGARAGEWARANNLELAYTRHSCQLVQPHRGLVHPLRRFCLDSMDHKNHQAQAFLIRRYITWRNWHAPDRMLCEVAKRANVA
ncbi:MAG: hypothetical protein ACRDRK_06825 [Pseudonocardia sp.]